MENNTFMLLLYVVFVLVYFASQYEHLANKLDANPPPSKWSYISNISLILIIVISVISNFNIVSDCDKLTTKDNFGIIFVSLAPWVFILGGLVVMLQYFPGWKAPFAETFGYLAVSSSKNQQLLSKLLPEKSKFRSNTFLKIFEFSLENFDSVAKQMFKPSASKEDLISFRNLVLIRDIVSQALWWLLTGLLIIMYQSSYVSSIKCVKHVDVPDSDDKKSQESKQEKKEKVYFVN